jgi:hypothetical protein
MMSATSPSVLGSSKILTTSTSRLLYAIPAVTSRIVWVTRHELDNAFPPLTTHPLDRLDIDPRIA